MTHRSRHRATGAAVWAVAVVLGVGTLADASAAGAVAALPTPVSTPRLASAADRQMLTHWLDRLSHAARSFRGLDGDCMPAAHFEPQPRRPQLVVMRIAPTPALAPAYPMAGVRAHQIDLPPPGA